MSLRNPVTLHEAYGRELAELLELVLAGDLVADRAVAERLVRSLGALVRLQQCHGVDEHGRCSTTCRSVPRMWWPWPKRITCTVHSALSFYLRQPELFVSAAVADQLRLMGA